MKILFKNYQLNVVVYQLFTYLHGFHFDKRLIIFKKRYVTFVSFGTYEMIDVLSAFDDKKGI